MLSDPPPRQNRSLYVTTSASTHLFLNMKMFLHRVKPTEWLWNGSVWFRWSRRRYFPYCTWRRYDSAVIKPLLCAECCALCAGSALNGNPLGLPGLSGRTEYSVRLIGTPDRFCRLEDTGWPGRLRELSLHVFSQYVTAERQPKLPLTGAPGLRAMAWVVWLSVVFCGNSICIVDGPVFLWLKINWKAI